MPALQDTLGPPNSDQASILPHACRDADIQSLADLRNRFLVVRDIEQTMCSADQLLERVLKALL